MQEEIIVPYMTLLHLGIISCPQCFSEMDSDVHLEAMPCPGCGTSLYMPLFLDNYVLYKPIGIGGVGCVYKALQKGTTNRFAIKLFHRSGHADDDEHPIVREATSGTAIGEHPNLVDVIEFGHDENEFYIVFL